VIEKFDITDRREQWLDLRKPDITASVASALLGAHDYVTAYELYLLKSDLVDSDPEESGPMRRGRLLEPVAAQLLSELRPNWKIQYPVGLYFRDTEARLGATPDCFATDENGKLGVIQFKSVEASIFRRVWRDEDRAISPPLYPVIQAITEAYLTGASWAAVAALVVGFGVELHIVEIPIHAGVIDRIKDEVAAFWDRVARKDPPPADYARDSKLIAKLFPESDGHIIDLSSDNMLPELAIQDRALADEIKERKERREAIKSEILMKLGTASGATFQGGRITANTVHRKAYSVAASQYRDLRIKLEDQGRTASWK
jgi:predicted phage-related endonuclease